MPYILIEENKWYKNYYINKINLTINDVRVSKFTPNLISKKNLIIYNKIYAVNIIIFI